jgi:hypothetical protein
VRHNVCEKLGKTGDVDDQIQVNVSVRAIVVRVVKSGEVADGALFVCSSSKLADF